MNKKNKKILLVVLAFVLVAAAASGTIAWLTRTNTLSNTFTVGTFELPTTKPTDSTSVTLNSHLYEPSWDSEAEHRLLPGTEYVKDPYVGLGEGSEDATVYVYVENNFTNKVYFTLNEGWEAVEGVKGSATSTYKSGLFKYTSGLSGAADKDVWTTKPLFDKVIVDEAATSEDLEVKDGKNQEIVISSFLHQVRDGNGNVIDEATILAAAKQAFGIQ